MELKFNHEEKEVHKSMGITKAEFERMAKLNKKLGEKLVAVSKQCREENKTGLISSKSLEVIHKDFKNMPPEMTAVIYWNLLEKSYAMISHPLVAMALRASKKEDK